MIDLYNKPKIINNINEGIFKNEEEAFDFPSWFIPFNVPIVSAAIFTP